MCALLTAHRPHPLPPAPVGCTPRLISEPTESLCSSLCLVLGQTHQWEARKVFGHSTQMHRLCLFAVSHVERSDLRRHATFGSASSLPRCGGHYKGVCACTCAVCVAHTCTCGVCVWRVHHSARLRQLLASEDTIPCQL